MNKRMAELMEIAHEYERTLVMGILNITPDSFSDGGLYMSIDDALRQAELMIEEGADILDIGGESTRPGSVPLSLEDELVRIVPVIREIARRFEIPISVDTYKARVAQEAIEAGASMINDISGLTSDPEMIRVAVESDAAVCIMHLQGTPSKMQENPVYVDVTTEVLDWLLLRIQKAEIRGIPSENIIIDPGFGFGKTVKHNVDLLHNLPEISAVGYPVLVGLSRKSTVGALLGGLPVNDRLEGSLAAAVLAVGGGASIVRTHDVKATLRAVRFTDAVLRKTVPA